MVRCPRCGIDGDHAVQCPDGWWMRYKASIPNNQGYLSEDQAREKARQMANHLRQRVFMINVWRDKWLVAPRVPPGMKFESVSEMYPE